MAGADTAAEFHKFLKAVTVEMTQPAFWEQNPHALVEALRLGRSLAESPKEVVPPKPLPSLEDDEGRHVLTVEEAADVLGIGRTLAYTQVRRGGIPSIKIGARILVPKAKLRKMLEGDQLA